VVLILVWLVSGFGGVAYMSADLCTAVTMGGGTVAITTTDAPMPGFRSAGFSGGLDGGFGLQLWFDVVTTGLQRRVVIPIWSLAALTGALTAIAWRRATRS
jgi:hypothetical protein